jgi:hypothetical protein
VQISRSKPDSLHRAPAGFTKLVLDGYGLRGFLPARPTSPDTGRFAPPLAVATPALTARPLHDGSLTVALVREAADPAAILTKAHGKPIAAPGAVCHPKGRSKAEDGAAVDRSRQAWPPRASLTELTIGGKGPSDAKTRRMGIRGPTIASDPSSLALPIPHG